MPIAGKAGRREGGKRMPSDGQDRQMLHTAVPVLASGAGSLPRHASVNRDKTRGAIGGTKVGLC